MPRLPIARDRGAGKHLITGCLRGFCLGGPLQSNGAFAEDPSLSFHARLFRSKLRREAEIHFAMQHKNIVRLLAFSEGNPGHPPCLVLERMEESLSHSLGTGDVPPIELRLETIKDICQVRP